ncbi:IS66 family insertion sequence element accessory protein TnpB [Alkalihalobacterium alkalinitrilicum]|nr:IS66 family insertion sequence element accessory protein TnpB [Alkalihalobacterium alkalinitrilicum]
MINQRSIDKVYLAKGSTDLRKSIDGLAAIVQESFQLDLLFPMSVCFL